MRGECPGCHDKYDYMGVHWTKSCGFPEIPQQKKEVLIGILLGDAWVNPPKGSNKKPYLQIASASKEYLEHLSGILGPFTTEVVEYREAHGNVKKQWSLRSRSHPYMKELRGWYGEDGKEFPDDFPFTPTVLKHWYACDGTAPLNHIEFAASNEQGNEHLKQRFKKRGYNAVWDGHKLRLRQEDSHALLDFMGEPIPGYEYKWKIK